MALSRDLVVQGEAAKTRLVMVEAAELQFLEMEQMGPTKTMVLHQLHMGLVVVAAATMSDVSTTEGQVPMADLFYIINARIPVTLVARGSNY